MIGRLKNLFDLRDAKPSGGRSANEIQIAAAALLVHVANVDENFSDTERELLLDFARDRFGLSAEEAAELIRAAEGMAGNSVQIHGFTRAIKDGFDYEDRVALVEMLWDVVYSDGRLDDLEAQVMRRICGLIYVEDRDSGLARRRVLDRLGRTDGKTEEGV